MEKLFHVKEAGSTVKTEVLAGVTTFMTMAYILMVNSGMFAELPGVSCNAIYIATAISACIGTVLIGLLANLPLAQASATYVNLASFNLLSGNVLWGDIMPLLVTFSALIVIAVLTCRGIKRVLCFGEYWEGRHCIIFWDLPFLIFMRALQIP